MPDGDGYVVLTGIGTVYKYGSAADPATLGTLGFPYSPGNDQSRSIAITPDGQGYVVLLANGTISKWGTAATGPLAALPSPVFSGDDARSIAVMPDGAGYLVLDRLGGVAKYGTAAAGPGRRGEHAVLRDRRGARHRARSAPGATTWSTAGAGIWASQQLPARQKPEERAVRRPLARRDDHRRSTGRVRNDGTTVTGVAS